MAYEQKDGSGSLFKNEKQKPTQPDYRGSIRINGVDLDLAAWIKKSAKGTTYMSLNAQPKRERDERKEAPPARQDDPVFDDDLPF
jgi:uncharacterized protein (DUF736 family)